MSKESDFEKELEKLIAKLSANVSAKEKARIKEYFKQYRKENKAKIRERDKKYYETNKEKIRNSARKYRKETPDYLEKGRTYFKAYRQRDYVKVKSNETVSKRRVLEIRTSKFELNSYGNILKLFKLSNKKAKETGRDYHVDHIVPLQGKLVSGFHVSGNLRVVLADTNLRKNDRYTARDEALIQRRMVKDWIANGVKFKLNKPKKR